jgi:transposase
MRGNNGSRYDEAFKREAVRLVFNSGKSVPAIAKDLGVSDNSLYLWKRAYGKEPDSTGMTPLEKENQFLKKELAEALMERDILKKAVAIFSTPRK